MSSSTRQPVQPRTAADASSPETDAEGNVAQPAPPDPDEELAVDSSNPAYSDADSAFDDNGFSTRTASITSSILNYKYENGRRYHAFREGAYVLPNDETEQDRLDLHHHVFRLTLDGRLFRAPITSTPRRVLDVGTGTGIWAIDFADEFPGAEVIGVDLSPIQPQWLPPSCKFYVDDIESDWLYGPDEAFDFIHGRGMGGSIQDWGRYYEQVYTHLNPGGWAEMQEYETWVRSDDGTVDNCPYIQQWSEVVNGAAEQFGKKMRVAAEQKQNMIDAGFEDVRDDVYKVPIGTWPRDKKLKEAGRYQLEQMCAAVEPFTLALLTRVAKWSHEETQVLMAGVRREFRSPRNHLYIAFHFIYGRKPDR